jgi:hypothetical protein
MTSSFKSAQVCNTAAMVRMVLQTATTFHQMQVYFDSALKDDNAMMSGLVSREIETFDTPAIVNTLQKAIDHAFLPDVHHSAWRLFLRTSLQQPQTPELQKIVARYLVDVSLTFNASEFLTRRMARWRHAVSSEAKDWWDFCGAFATQLCQCELKGAAQCVVAAFLKTILNGWASTRRLQLQPRACLFGCGSKHDCIEHYLVCRHVEEIWTRLHHSDWGPLECRLGIGSSEVSDRVKRAFFLYAIFNAYNHLRHHSRNTVNLDHYITLVKSKILFALGKSSCGMRQLHQDQSDQSRSGVRDWTGTKVGDVIFTFRKRALATNSTGKRDRHEESKNIKGANKRIRPSA